MAAIHAGYERARMRQGDKGEAEMGRGEVGQSEGWPRKKEDRWKERLMTDREASKWLH